ncbi:hypothetical protein AVEN_193130-1 [Araneus ventricosus]|uniref:F-box domain-containing protein n=1 Tax=Araneus ventricosus TaxID=182803 RepID=A0A4Y2AZZ6_ARAVE|nr:hypothetical protein AVEN_193130-1 [Araneus ventricosus]
MDAGNTSEIVSDANAIDDTGMQYTTEKLDSETAQSIASNETDECEKQGQWSELPALPIEKIYSFLSRRDQVNMSLVCLKWSEGYSSPSVWKTFRFALKKSQLSKDTCPVMKFVQKYNSMFRHVKVSLDFSLKKRLIKTWCRHFIAFLQILTDNSQLISVEFQDLSHCFLKIDNTTFDDTCRAIANFLGSQHHLKRVEFRYCWFEFPEAVEILRKLTEKSRKSLTHLVIRKFVRYNPMKQEQDSIFTQNLPTLADLPSLTNLEIDYALIFENMVARQYTAPQTVKNCQTLVLSKIILDYQQEVPPIEDLRGLTSTDWRFLKMLCPNLQVELFITAYSPSRRELEFLIVPNIPITRLEYKESAFDMEVETDVLFDLLLVCKTNDHLVSLRLLWDAPVQDLASPFIPFLLACNKLKYLELFTIYPTNVTDLMEYWLYNPPEYLEKVNIEIWEIPDEENYTILMNLTSEYVSRLELIGLNVKVFLNIYSIVT